MSAKCEAWVDLHAESKGLFSSVGRACAPQAHGHGFDPHRRLCVEAHGPKGEVEANGSGYASATGARDKKVICQEIFGLQLGQEG